MVTLYKYRGQVDLIVTDPPYNTGEDFRYNDKWDKDPNDPNLGELILRSAVAIALPPQLPIRLLQRSRLMRISSRRHANPERRPAS